MSHYIQMARPFVPDLISAAVIGACADHFVKIKALPKGPWYKASFIGIAIFRVLGYYYPSNIPVRIAVGAASGFALGFVPIAELRRNALAKFRLVSKQSIFQEIETNKEKRTINANHTGAIVAAMAMGGCFGYLTAR